MKLSKTEATLRAAALKAGMTEKTARQWRQRAQQPSEQKTPRTYRTRADPFAGVWGELETFLLCDASVEALTLFEYLSRTYPDQFQEQQVRTLQRRVKVWRLEHGAERARLLSAEARARTTRAKRFHAHEGSQCDHCRPALRAFVVSLHADLLELGVGNGLCDRIL